MLYRKVLSSDFRSCFTISNLEMAREKINTINSVKTILESVLVPVSVPQSPSGIRDPLIFPQPGHRKCFSLSKGTSSQLCSSLALGSTTIFEGLDHRQPAACVQIFGPAIPNWFFQLLKKWKTLGKEIHHIMSPSPRDSQLVNAIAFPSAPWHPPPRGLGGLQRATRR